MNLRTVFKAQAVVLFLNAIGALFLTSAFLGAAGWEITADLITLGQFTGMTFLVFAIYAWRLPDVASRWRDFIMPGTASGIYSGMLLSACQFRLLINPVRWRL